MLTAAGTSLAEERKKETFRKSHRTDTNFVTADSLVRTIVRAALTKAACVVIPAGGAKGRLNCVRLNLLPASDLKRQYTLNVYTVGAPSVERCRRARPFFERCTSAAVHSRMTSASLSNGRTMPSNGLRLRPAAAPAACSEAVGMRATTAPR